MVKNCFLKITLSNAKLLLLSILFCTISFSVVAQKKQGKDYQKIKDKEKQENKEVAAEKYEKLKKRQYEIQSKNVKKRMDENKKATDSYYKQKTKKPFFQGWFTRKGKRN